MNTKKSRYLLRCLEDDQDSKEDAIWSFVELVGIIFVGGSIHVEARIVLRVSFFHITLQLGNEVLEFGIGGPVRGSTEPIPEPNEGLDPAPGIEDSTFGVEPHLPVADADLDLPISLVGNLPPREDGPLENNRAGRPEAVKFCELLAPIHYGKVSLSSASAVPTSGLDIAKIISFNWVKALPEAASINLALASVE